MSRHNQVNTNELKPTRSAPMAGSRPSQATTSTASSKPGWIEGRKPRPRKIQTPRRSAITAITPLTLPPARSSSARRRSPGSTPAERIASISSANDSALRPA
jgi:hypothetical protein